MTRNTEDWHALTSDQVMRHLDTTSQGLDDAQVTSRRELYGLNRLRAQTGKPAWQRFAIQLLQPLVATLLVAAGVTAFLGEWVDASVILAVVLLNASVGFLQEGKAEAALAALARSVLSEVTVLRGGKKIRVSSLELFPGDVMAVAAGDRVVADARLVRGEQLAADEAALTGESLPVPKAPVALGRAVPLAERANMLYGGTTITAGRGVAVVVATGEATEVGRIARAIDTLPQLTTPLLRKMAVFAQRLLIVIGVLAGFTFAVGLARGEPAFDMFMAAVALAVGAIPEGLPAALTITLAIGVARMARRRAVIRKLPAVETLGSVTVICSDKTGTLTENQMTVLEVFAGGESFAVSGTGYSPEGVVRSAEGVAVMGPALRECVLAGLLCNDAELHHHGGQWQVVGDPTEGALLVLGRKAGLDEVSLRQVLQRLTEIPFTSEHRWMATLHAVEGEQVVYLKGAVEQVLAHCTCALAVTGEPAALDHALIEARAVAMAASGLRVLALARASCQGGEDLPETVAAGGFVFLGLVAMMDPPRPRAIAAVKICHAAGVAVKMITGDHPLTALAIARRLGIVDGEAVVKTGSELGCLGDADLQVCVREVSVFARVEPEQKLRLVRALQANGEVVAMTGDGVNDAPALKAADIGIAMGLGGTEVAKEAAAMVLLDDNFATIEAALEEGRGIYANLVKFITWTLPTNFGEGLVIVAAIGAGVTLPITPLQILWINLCTAVLLGMVLAFEPVEHGIMRRPPHPPGAPILTSRLMWRIVLVSVLMLAAAFGLFLHELAQGHSLAQARTVAMNVFVFVEIFYLFNCRSLSASFVSVGLWSNPWVWWGVLGMVALQLAVTYLPPLQVVFNTAPIGLREWAEVVGVAFLASLAVGAEKRWWPDSAPPGQPRSPLAAK